MYGQRLGTLFGTLGLVSGITVPESTQGSTLGNLGFETAKFPRPVFTRSPTGPSTADLSKRESKSRDDSGDRLLPPLRAWASAMRTAATPTRPRKAFAA